MKKFFSLALTCILVFGTTTAFAANDFTDLKLTDNASVHDSIEMLEKLGLWKEKNSSLTAKGTLIEATRYDDQKAEMLLYKENGNDVVVIESEGKTNTLIITPSGEYYWDEVSKENKIEARYLSAGKSQPEADSKATSETWITDITPFDDGPYVFNNNMTKEIDIDFNRNLGSLTLEAIMLTITPFVPVLEYFNQFYSMLTVGCQLIDLYVDLNPNLRSMYVQEKYFNGDSKTTGRPLEYCYKVQMRFANDETFSSFVHLPNGNSFQVMYAKQLIYA